MRTKLTLVIVGLFLAGGAASLRAHHAFAAEFDSAKPVKFKGTVTKMEWLNPHVWLHIDVKEPNGSERTVPARFYKGIAAAWHRGRRRRVSGEGRHEKGKRQGSHVPRRTQAVPRIVRHRSPVRTDARQPEGAAWEIADTALSPPTHRAPARSRASGQPSRHASAYSAAGVCSTIGPLLPLKMTG